MSESNTYTEFLLRKTKTSNTNPRVVRVDSVQIDNLINELEKYYPGISYQSFGHQVDFIVFLLEKSIKEKIPTYLSAYEKRLIKKRCKVGAKRKDIFAKQEEQESA